VPIILQIEVSESGLHATKDEIAAFLAHASTQTEATAHLAYAILRKMLRAAEQAEGDLVKEAKAKDALKPRPTVRELRRCA
jgi:hypothetical protein